MLNIMIKHKKHTYRPHASFSIEKKNKRTSHFTFLVFVIISAVFWLLIKLSQEYSQTYDMNIQYKDIPMDKLLTKKIDSTVKFSITARGFYLVELSLLHPDELIIHLNNYTIHNAEEDIYYISTLPLKEKIAKLLDINSSDISFSKNTLSFLLEKLHSKKVKVVSDIQYGFYGSYSLYKPPAIHPAEVEVFGTKQTLDTINTISTKHIELKNIKESRSMKVELENPLPGLLRIDPDKVTLDITVEKFTQSSIETSINASLGNTIIETFPKKVTIYFNVALKDYDKVKANQFLVSPDFTNLDLNTEKRLHLIVKKHPDFVRNIRIEPSSVEFIIVNK